MAELVTQQRPIKIYNPSVDQIYQMMRPNVATNPANGPLPAPTPVYMIPKPQTPAAGAIPNSVAIGEPNGATQPEGNKKLLLVGAVGLGALLLMSGGKKVSGKKNKSMLVPLLIVGGAAAFYFFTKKPAAADPGAGDDPYAEDSPVIVAPDEVQQHARSTAAENSLGYLRNYWPTLNNTFNAMTDPEIITMYQYLYGYVSQGKKLYQYPGPTGIYPDGGWDTGLYNSVMAIKSKYNLNI